MHALARFALSLVLTVVVAGCPSSPTTDTDSDTPGADTPGGACDPGDTRCGAVCADTERDPRHCGACGMACASGEACAAGRCAAPMCAAGETACGGTCVDTDTDRTHCGACGMACGASETCEGGRCTASCAAPNMLCTETTPEGTRMVCRTVASDPANCGACGNACAGDETCTAGVCNCGPDEARCSGACVDTRMDNNNCGTCGMVCPVETELRVCTAGRCACRPGRTDCGPGLCVNTDIDGANCGRCGNACAAGESCGGGVCSARCAGMPGTTLCGADCVDVTTNQMNCGACGNVCGAGTTCRASVCRPNNDLRENAIDIPLPLTLTETTVTGTTLNAETDGGPGGCYCVDGPTVWYRITLPQDQIMYFDTFGTTWDASLHVLDATGAPALFPAGMGGGPFCDDDSRCAGEHTQPQLAGRLARGTYFLGVSGCSSGPFTLHVQHISFDSAGRLFWNPIASGVGRVTGTLPTTGSSASSGRCVAMRENSPEDGYWFTTCGDDRPVAFSMCPSDGGSWTYSSPTSPTGYWDPTLTLYSCQTGEFIACNDDVPACPPTDIPAGPPYGSRLETMSDRGLHLLVVDERSVNGGMPYTLFGGFTR